MTRHFTFWMRVLHGAAGFAFAAFTGIGLFEIVSTVGLRLAAATEAALCGPAAFRATERGSRYQTAIERIGRVLGPKEPYLLVDGGGKAGEPFWVRHELAPRRVSLLGALSREGDLSVFTPLPDPLPTWVVVVPQWPEPPRLVESIVLLQARHQALVRGSDPRVFGTLSSARVTPAGLVLTGACVARSVPACVWPRVFLDGEERHVTRLVRRPLPDLPGSGAGPSDLAEAGFEAAVALEPTDRGPVVVSIVYLTADRRFRSPFPLTVDVTR